MDSDFVTDRQTPQAVREACRRGAHDRPTGGLALGYAQANLVVLEKDLADDFLLFCQRNPKPCPLVDVTDPGNPEPAHAAPGADLRTDLPRYRIYENGKLVGEPTDIIEYWRVDSVGFLIGCSFTFERAMLAAGLALRHHREGGNVPMYVTNVECTPAGRFAGPMVVSMRPLPRAQAITAIEVTGQYPRAHGAPVHWGDPAAIGIGDIMRPDFGDPMALDDDEVPVFWACGVTPQTVMMRSRPALAITHAPGHMFVADLRDDDFRH